MNPLILPVKTPFGFYFYEAQRNEIISIDKEVFQYLYQTFVANTSGTIESPADKNNRNHVGAKTYNGYLAVNTAV